MLPRTNASNVHKCTLSKDIVLSAVGCAQSNVTRFLQHHFVSTLSIRQLSRPAGLVLWRIDSVTTEWILSPVVSGDCIIPRMTRHPCGFENETTANRQLICLGSEKRLSVLSGGSFATNTATVVHPRHTRRPQVRHPSIRSLKLPSKSMRVFQSDSVAVYEIFIPVLVLLVSWDEKRPNWSQFRVRNQDAFLVNWTRFQSERFVWFFVVSSCYKRIHFFTLSWTPPHLAGFSRTNFHSPGRAAKRQIPAPFLSIFLLCILLFLPSFHSFIQSFILEVRIRPIAEAWIILMLKQRSAWEQELFLQDI